MHMEFDLASLRSRHRQQQQRANDCYDYKFAAAMMRARHLAPLFGVQAALRLTPSVAWL